jgi:fatty acid amide hydrolase 2
MLKAMCGEDIHKLPKLETKVDLKRVRVYYMLDDEDPLKTRVTPEIKEGILKVVKHMEDTFKVESKALCIREFKKTAIMWFACLKEAGGTPMSQMVNDRKFDTNVWLEILKSAVGSSNHTRAALLFAAVEKFVPGVDSNFVQSGLKLRDTLIQELNTLLGDDGVLILPSHPEAAPKHGTTIPKTTNIAYTTILNILGLPATQVPMGLNRSGVPIGLQVAATRFNDHLTLAMATEIETKFGGWVPPSQVQC